MGDLYCTFWFKFGLDWELRFWGFLELGIGEVNFEIGCLIARKLQICLVVR